MLASVKKVALRPDMDLFPSAVTSPMSSPAGQLLPYVTALAALVTGCPNIVDIELWSPNVAAFSNALRVLRDCQLQSLDVFVVIKHGTHVQSAARLIAHTFSRLDNLTICFLDGIAADPPFVVDPSHQRLTVPTLILNAPSSSNALDGLFETFDPSQLVCAAVDIGQASLELVKWAALSERWNVLSVKIHKSILRSFLIALSGASRLSLLKVRPSKDDTDDWAESPVPFDELTELLPNCVGEVDMIKWIFDVPPGGFARDAHSSSHDLFPVLRLSKRAPRADDESTETTVATFRKLQFGDGPTRWYECVDGAGLYALLHSPSRAYLY